jgi:hypothetical protein
MAWRRIEQYLKCHSTDINQLRTSLDEWQAGEQSMGCAAFVPAFLPCCRLLTHGNGQYGCIAFVLRGGHADGPESPQGPVECLCFLVGFSDIEPISAVLCGYGLIFRFLFGRNDAHALPRQAHGRIIRGQARTGVLFGDFNGCSHDLDQVHCGACCDSDRR